MVNSESQDLSYKVDIYCTEVTQLEFIGEGKRHGVKCNDTYLMKEQSLTPHCMIVAALNDIEFYSSLDARSPTKSFFHPPLR